MKIPIEFHEQCLRESESYYQDLLFELDFLQKKINILKDRNDLLRNQILQAKIQNKKAFDADKFLKGK